MKCLEIFWFIIFFELKLQEILNLIDMKPELGSIFQELIKILLLKLMILFQIFISNILGLKKNFLYEGLSTLLNFSVFTFFEYQKMVCKEFKQKRN